MSVVYIALPVSLVLVLAAVVAFVWSLRSGQFDDLETPSVRLLMEDEEVERACSRDRAGQPEAGSPEETVGGEHARRAAARLETGPGREDRDD